MHVTGMYYKRALQILLDSGSTHNFLDLAMAKLLECRLEAVTTPISITGGGGHKLQTLYICKGFTWTLQQLRFTIDVMVFPLVCCDLLLGVEWLRSLGTILWDFDKLHMEFHVTGKKVSLRGAKTPSTKLISNKAMV